MRFSRPSGYSPSSSWERVVRKSSGTLWVGVTVPYPHARGAQQGIPVPIPREHPRRQAGRAKVALPLRPGSELSAAVPEVAVPVPITRSDNQLPSAAVTSPGGSGRLLSSETPSHSLSVAAPEHTRAAFQDSLTYSGSSKV